METRIGIDIGGTFTDLVFLNADGRVLRAKVLSTPEDYSLGISAGIGTIIALMLPFAAIILVASTVLFVAWYLLGIPWGPGAPVHL
jgi:N-methylhydantoinase A/oxoprolinase/acetone carboxylase beta subunit